MFFFKVMICSYSNKGSKLLNNIIKLSKIKIIKTMERGLMITEDLVGSTLHIYNGLYYFPLTITYEMIGFKLGDFIFTKRRSREIHVNNKISSKKKKTKFL